MTITLPLPPRELSPNWRGHWAQKAKAVKKYRQLAWAVAMSETRCNWPTANAQATFYFRDRRRRDRDNLLASLKSAFDGLTDAGVIDDDSGLTHLPVIVEYDKANPRVEITVEGGK